MASLDINIHPHLFMIIAPCILELGVLNRYKQTIFNLALVNKEALKITEPYISQFHFWVKTYKKKGPITLKYYKPKKISDVPRLPCPLQITHLSFSEKFNENFYSPNQLPPSLTHVRFGAHFNSNIANNVLPEKLASLGFGDKFNHQLPNELPAGLKHLWFGTDFNMPITSLPQGLTHLSFGLQPHIFLWEWNDKSIVDLVTSTFFAVQREDKFNQSLTGVLPPSLSHLSLSTCFAHPLIPPNPNNIAFLRVGEYFEHPIPFRKLPHLSKLVLGWQSTNRPLQQEKFPSHLTNLVSFYPSRDLRRLKLNSLAASFSYDEPNHFPHDLKRAYFLNHFRFYSDVSSYLQFLPIFTVMTHLVLHIQGVQLTLEKYNLPPAITHLHILLWSSALEKVKIVSPTLLSLSLPRSNYIELNTPKLTHISLAKVKRFPLLPLTTTHVAFGPLQKKFPKKKGSHPLPLSITHLKLGPSFSSLPPLPSPSRLTHLTFTSPNIAINSSSSLPSSLQTLTVPRSALKHIKLPLFPHLEFAETTAKEEGYEWRPVMFDTDW